MIKDLVKKRMSCSSSRPTSLTTDLFGRAESVARGRARSVEDTVTAEYDLDLALVRPQGLNKGRYVIPDAGALGSSAGWTLSKEEGAVHSGGGAYLILIRRAVLLRGPGVLPRAGALLGRCYTLCCMSRVV